MKSTVVSALFIGMLSVMVPACDESGECGKPPTKSSGCLAGCETQDDCEASLVCEAVPGMSDGRFCTRPCTSSKDCQCNCASDASQGFCGVIEGPLANTC